MKFRYKIPSQVIYGASGAPLHNKERANGSHCRILKNFGGKEASIKNKNSDRRAGLAEAVWKNQS